MRKVPENIKFLNMYKNKNLKILNMCEMSISKNLENVVQSETKAKTVRLWRSRYEEKSIREIFYSGCNVADFNHMDNMGE